MPNVFQRLWDSIGFNDRFPEEMEYDYEYNDGYPPEEYETGNVPAANPQPTAASNVIGLPGRGTPPVTMIVMEPRTFEEVPQAVAALRERKTVILNLGLMDPDSAQRSVDFVAGGSFAIDGHQERLGENIFLFTPSFIQINNYPGLAQPSTPAQPTPQAPAVQPSQRVAPQPYSVVSPPPPGWEVPPRRA